MKIRYPAVAGHYYPSDAHMLKQAVLEYLGKAEDLPEIPGKVKAIVAPHAGYIYSGTTAGYAYKMLRVLDQEKNWEVVLLGNSHHCSFAGAAVPDEQGWQSPLGFVPVKDLREKLGGLDGLEDSELFVEMPESNREEHSLEVQLPFLQLCLANFDLYPLVLGSLRADFLAEELADFAKRENSIIVVSSDLSHNFPDEKAREVDHSTSEAICGIDVEKMAEKGDACGRTGILTLMLLAEKLGWKCKMLDYSNSGNITGELGRVVGYGAYVFYE